MREPLYPHSREEAHRNGEIDKWRASYKENVRCKEFIDQCVSERYNGQILPGSIITDAICEFGISRVEYVLANTIKEKGYDGRIRPETKKWADNACFVPKDSGNPIFELATHPELINGLVGAFRKHLSKELHIVGKEDCIPFDDEYIGKLLILRKDALAEDYKKGEFQYFYAHGGFGCYPNTLGRKVFGIFLTDGEKATFERSDFLGVADTEKLPDWAKEKLSEITATQTEQTTNSEGGMQLQ